MLSPNNLLNKLKIIHFHSILFNYQVGFPGETEHKPSLERYDTERNNFLNKNIIPRYIIPKEFKLITTSIFLYLPSFLRYRLNNLNLMTRAKYFADRPSLSHYVQNHFFFSWDTLGPKKKVRRNFYEASHWVNKKGLSYGLGQYFQDLAHSFSPFQSLNSFWIIEYSFTSSELRFSLR